MYITFNENLILLGGTSNNMQLQLARNELEQSLSKCFIAPIGHDCGISERILQQAKDFVNHPFIKEVHVSSPVLESLKTRCVRDIGKLSKNVR